MKITEYLKNNFLILDGGMGTLLQNAGLRAGEYPERWNITHKEEVIKIHRDYFNAGSNVVNTNTFGANSLKFSDEELEEIIKSAVENAKIARDTSDKNGKEKFVALDIGPTGKLLKPYGELDFEDAVSVFSKTVKLGEKYGVDLVFIETMNDSYETKAALLAVKENTSLPVFVSNAYGEDGKLMTGADPLAMVTMLEGMGADAIGVNCSLGPKSLAPIVEKYLEYSSLPVIMKPNAGLPKSENGKTVYDVTGKEFANEVFSLMEKGVRIVGGCCGTTPDEIRILSEKATRISPVLITEKNITAVSSYTHAVVFDKSPILIGERINPTGKKRFKQALKENDIPYILDEGLKQQEKGVHVLDVNVGLPDIDETEMLTKVSTELQAIIDLPLQIDTSDPVAMEKALRRYNGKAMINSVNGKEESMKAIFPLVKKYGGVVVALTLDENGIPETVEGRVEIAKKILKVAKEYGIEKKDLIFDTLTMTVSAEPKAGIVTLKALNIIKNELGCHTSLGVSNVSFGLPERDMVNGTFFALALENGLSAAIINPHSLEIIKTYYTFRTLHDLDENCSDYINFASENKIELQTVADEKANSSDLQNAIIKGLKQQAQKITEEKIKTADPLEIVNNEIIPALDNVGKGFENKTVFLPGLLMSAEAAKSAFEVIKVNMPSNVGNGKCRIVIATVKGDIHDIGKNIVKLLLENYGFEVYDLGKDVAPQKIVDTAKEVNASIIGLSALMTTTVPSMEETISIAHKQIPDCKIVVGGAVLTKEYAKKIKADYYAKDAMETVRYAEKINDEK